MLYFPTDEETGCYVGKDNVKVKIMRRWNYENRIAAIVCRASLGKYAMYYNIKGITD